MGSKRKNHLATLAPVEFDRSGKRIIIDTKLDQRELVFQAFFRSPKSMLEVEAITGVMRSNVCYYVGDWQKSGKIQRLKTGYCNISQRKVGKYSTNPKHWEKMEEK